MSRWRTLRSWLRAVVFPWRVDRDIDDELRFHVEEQMEAGVSAGLPPDKARRLAYASLGDPPALVREQCRDQRSVAPLDDFVRDLIHGARQLRRNPGFTTAILTTVAIAIGATVTVFSIVDAWLFRPLNFPEAERLVIAFASTPERPCEPALWLPYRAYLAWKDRSRSVASVSAAFVRDVTLTTPADARTLLGLSVTPEFFETFGVGSFLGRTLSDEDVTGPDAVVLSYGLWQRQFGGATDVIGTPVTLSGTPHNIVGVMPRDFETRVVDIRAAIGSGRGRLVRQFMAESLLIAVLGGIAGLALAAGATGLFVAWNPLGTLPANAIQLDLRALAAACAAMAVVAIASGLMLALYMSHVNPGEALRGGDRGAAPVPAQRAQVAMLIAQMAGCVVLLVATTLLIRTFVQLQEEPLGFDASNLSVANVILPNDPFASSEKRNLYFGQSKSTVRIKLSSTVMANFVGHFATRSNQEHVSIEITTFDAELAEHADIQTKGFSAVSAVSAFLSL